MSNRLLQAFTYFSNTIEDMRSLVFDGREDPNGRSFKFADLGITGTPPVASFFKDGRLLFDAKDGQTKLNGQFQQVMTLLKKSLIAGMLHDLKAYIVRDSSQQGRDRLCKKTGSRLVGNECFFIVRASEKRGNEVEEIGNDAMLAFDKYGINIEHLYSNAAACQDKNPSFDGWDKFLASAVPQDLLASTVAMDGNNYPECFWGALPVFTVTEESRKKAIDRADIDGVCVSTANPEPDQNQTPNVPKHLGVEACPVSYL
ncbi:hypothetical protein QBC38DRAFT_385589 [Podospora fimiseda]|uniref:Uncharacterized protein n=1 Tax=Podospora fimiseda TaxID=252190 RepID=A0AAN7H371_9PEZI|nr:hypothetical protein QBC38DRAFT_385589 [Podospora fimiseda]